MFGWLSRRLIEHYEAEIAWLRAEVRYEKHRADRALDALASQHGQHIVTALPAMPVEAEPAVDVNALLKDSEFAQAGVG